MFRIIKIAALLFVTSALAGTFSVTDEDQSNIASICAIAARSPNIDIQINAQVAGWCVNWQNRMKAAAQAPKPEPKPDEAKP